MRSFGGPTTEDAVAFWNNQLPSRIENFTAGKAGSDVTLTDTSRPWNTAIDNPPASGAQDDICTICQGAPDETCGVVEEQKCLWYNSYHPGTTIHKLIADEVDKDLEGWL